MTNITKFLNHNEMEPWDVLFRNFFDSDSFFMPALTASTKYPVDIHEDENSLNIEIAVAGIDKKDIQIEEEDGILRVSYSKQEEIDKEQEGRHYLQKGIARRAFNFGWRISDKFNIKNIDATMDKGILKISVPKTEEKQIIKNTIKIK